MGLENILQHLSYMHLISVLDGLNSDFCAGHENPDTIEE